MNKAGYKTKLSNIASVIQGQSPESTYYSDQEGTPFLQGNRTFGNLYPKFDTFTKKVTKLARKGEVLMSVRAPVGDLNFAPCDLCIGRGLASLNSKSGNNKFLYYALKYNVGNLLKQGAATTFDSVNKDIINDFELIIPEDSSQRDNVEAVLSSLDYKIDLNNRINAELEKIAKTFYDYWFVQFDFPDNNSRPYKTSGGKMIWDEKLKREIPEGWSAISIKKLLSVSKNGDWGANEENTNLLKVYCFRGADINALNGKDSELNPPVRYIDHKHKDRLLKADDLIVEISGGSPTQSTGRIAHIGQKVFNRFDTPIVCSNFCKAISFKEPRHSYLIKQYWNSLYEAGIFFNFEGKTSGIKNLLFDQLVKDISIPLPEKEQLVKDYYNFASEIDSLVQNNLAENKILSDLRDWLLPMLMNGQVKIK
jgi:type I restriction enzyme S subunit